MRFQCPFCSYTMRGITNSMLSRKVECPDCGKKSRLPKYEFAEGRVIGDFIIKRQLGVGSIGAVFLAHQISLDRAVALKILSREYSNNKGIEAFLKEARAAAKLSHPNLVQALAANEEEGTCFMAMNFIEGETVKDKIEREGKVKVDEALHIVQQVAEALHYAWSEAGLIHRDVKPENIMITKEGAVKLTDLGLAMKETEWHENLEISGSPSYMSPEQFTGEKLDTRSDIYSLGISLYQILSGELPFQGKTLKTVAKQHFHEASKPLNKIDPMIPLRVSQLVQKMTAKDPAKRFQTMEDLIKDIWGIRQKTAPDRNLVPSVHTISIKRLDYELQEKSEERKKLTAEEKKQELHKHAIITRMLFIGTPIILVFVIFFMMYKYSENKLNKTTASNVSAFEDLMNTDSTSPDSLLKEWETTMQSLSSPKNDFQRELHTRMQLYKAKIENLKIKKRLKALSEKAYSTTESKKEKEKQLKTLLAKNKMMSAELQTKISELDNARQLCVEKEALLKSKLKNIQQAQRTKNNKIIAKIKKLNKQLTNLWKNGVRRKTFTLVAKHQLPGALAYLNIEREKHPMFTNWLTTLHKKVEKLDTLLNAFNMSGSKYADTQIEEGILKNILVGKVSYTAKPSLNDGVGAKAKDKEVDWYELKDESLYTIAEQVFPDATESEIKAMVLLLLGKQIAAAGVMENDPEINAIADAACSYKMDIIKIYYSVDRQIAKDKAREFIKAMDSTSPKIKMKYREQIKKLFSSN